MKWEMEIEEIETVLEKIWDLHDKLSDAIHSISRAHFLSSIKAQRRSHRRSSAAANDGASDENRAGFVFVKDFRVDADDDSAIQEAKSLNAIRTALENLEDQLEIFHTVQVQQRAERDAAISRLEQSRIVLAMRLAEHHGKKYKVIEEALAFVGEVKESNHFVTPEKLYRDSPSSSSGENLATTTHERNRPNFVHNVLLSSLGLAKRALKLDFLGGVLGNAAMVAISMVALIHLQQAANSRHEQDIVFSNRRVRKTAQLQESSSDDRSSNLDVLSARG